MKHKITIDKKNKVLKLKVTIPKKKYHKDPNISDIRFEVKEAWDLVKDKKIEGYSVAFAQSLVQLDNFALFRHEGEFVFPLKELPKKTVASAKKSPAKENTTKKPRRPRKASNKAENAKN